MTRGRRHNRRPGNGYVTRAEVPDDYVQVVCHYCARLGYVPADAAPPTGVAVACPACMGLR